MPPLSSVSVVIPAHNEEASIAGVLEEAVGSLPLVAGDFEIIVADDGSVDRTVAVARMLAADDPRVRVVSAPRRRGKGHAFRLGLEAARMDWVALLDADGQIPASSLVALAQTLGIGDAAIGYRRGSGRTLVRRIGSRAYALLVRALLGVRVRDLNCPCKIARRDVLREVGLTAEGWGIDAELIWALETSGHPVRQAAVDARPRSGGRSKVSASAAILSFAEVLRLRRDRRRRLMGRG